MHRRASGCTGTSFGLPQVYDGCESFRGHDEQSRARLNQGELINTGTDKRYVHRDKEGRVKESVEVSRSLAQDVRNYAETRKPRNRGDKSD